MKNTIERLNSKLFKKLLPWIATAVTALPYSDYRSQLLDRLVSLAEK